MPTPLFRWSLLPLLVLSAHAHAGEKAAGLFTEGKPIFDLRYRYEYVDQDNALGNANANTLRSRVGFRSGDWHGVSGLIEVDNVSQLGPDRFNDTRNGHVDRAVVADPAGTEVNQALLRYAGEHASLDVGRQRITLGNERFVSPAAWRQNEQTFDGASLQWTPLKNFAFTYAWIEQVNTVFGPTDDGRANAGNRANIEGDSQLFHLRYTFAPQLAATAYHYRLDLENAAVSATAPLGTLSSITTGLRLDGGIAGLDYVIEYATQRDGRGNPWRLDSDYQLLELGYALRGVRFTAGREVLGGAGGAFNTAFQTPLAAKHRFQGWADVFLTTPVAGIRDHYLGLSSPIAGGTLQLWYHDFSPERGGGDYGREYDLSYARAIPGVRGLSGLAKYARYVSDDRSRTVDTEKFWLQLQYSY